MRVPGWLAALGRHLAPPFRWVDRQVQRGVDAASFALARRGYLKGAQHRSLARLETVAWVAGTVAWCVADISPSWVIFTAICLLVARFSWRNANARYQLDAYADERGRLTARDEPSAMIRASGWFRLACWSGCLASSPFANRMGWTLYVISAVAELGYYYLHGTPRQPPPARQTQHVPATSAA